MTIFMALRTIYDVCLIATMVVGLRLGGRSERAGSLILLAATLSTAMVERTAPFDWLHHRTGLIVVDVIVLVAFFTLALKSRRFWPLWATAFHLIAVGSHCVVFLRPSRTLQVYALFQGFWAYPIMALIIGAAVLHARRRATAATPITIATSNRPSINSNMRSTD